jgi:exopolysaccharide biosynthesis polyprenyl glycosylphosphotransferase
MHHVVIVGSGVVADQLASAIRQRVEMGLHFVGFVDDLDGDRPSPSDWLGNLADLPAVIRSNQISRVILAPSVVRDRELVRQLRLLEPQPIELFVVPRLFEFGSSAGDMRTQSCGGIPIVWMPHRAWRVEQLVLKRAFDLVVAATALILLLPILLVTAVLVRLSSRGPILLKQTRVGKGEQVFEMLKFRSMRLPGPGDQMNRSGGGDPRITRIGKVIRRLSIDELPQFVNVIRGSMSIVGPRPEQPQFVEEALAVPGYKDRHRLQVGLTGWSQVHRLRGTNTSLEDRARYDNYYIEHWSIWLDLVVLIRTITAALRGS